MEAGGGADVRVPCDGRYRLRATSPLRLDGRPLGDGDVVELEGERAYRLSAADAAALPAEVTLTWAAARPPPEQPPPRMPLYGH